MKKKLRIAMFVSCDPSKAGGVQEHIYFLSDYLRRRGHKVDIFGPASPERKPTPFKGYRSLGNVVQVPTPNGNWANINVGLEEINFQQIISKKKYDICHIHEPYTPFLSWQLAKEVAIPIVGTFHTAWNDDSIVNVLNAFLPFLKKTFSSYFKGAIFVSEIARKRWKPLCDKNVYTRKILHGIDDSFHPIKKNNGTKIRLLFLARLVPRKGLKYLLKALIKLIKEFPHLQLTIIGDGPERNKLEKFCQQHSLLDLDNVIFKGEIMGKQKIQYYQEADIFCAPYSDEAFALTILEAMACGCPIVGFKNEAFKETLKNYPAPELIVGLRNVDRLTGALRKLIFNKKLWMKLRHWCIEKSKEFNWKKVAWQTEKFYYHILQDNYDR